MIPGKKEVLNAHNRRKNRQNRKSSTRFIVSVNDSHMRTEAELREFKDDVKESHMRTEAERREFKDEMRNYKEENRQQIRER